MKKFLFAIAVLLLFAAGCKNTGPAANLNQSANDNANTVTVPPNPVNANSSNQNFTPPPAASSSGIVGKIVLGPTCPVETNPPTPGCAPKPYQATILVETIDGTKELARFTSASDGTFKVNLAPGSYLLVPDQTSQRLPRGETQTVTVTAHQYASVTINFDTGIR